MHNLFVSLSKSAVGFVSAWCCTNYANKTAEIWSTADSWAPGITCHGCTGIWTPSQTHRPWSTTLQERDPRSCRVADPGACSILHGFRSLCLASRDHHGCGVIWSTCDFAETGLDDSPRVMIHADRDSLIPIHQLFKNDIALQLKYYYA